MGKFSKIKETIRQSTGTRDSQSVAETVRLIPFEHIRVRENIRKEFSNIESPSKSICQYGLLNALIVYRKEENSYMLIAGERRYRAWKLLWEENKELYHDVRCFVVNSKNITESRITELQIAENYQRANLSLLEFVDVLKFFKDKDMKPKEIACEIGLKEGHLKNLLVGYNEIQNDMQLREFLSSHVDVTMQDVLLTKGIKEMEERFRLLEQRDAGELSQYCLREQIKEKRTRARKPQQAAEANSHVDMTTPQQKVSVLVSVQCNKLVISLADIQDDGVLLRLQEGFLQYLQSLNNLYDVKTENKA
jgi:ParB family chromosome partitioning protein